MNSLLLKKQDILLRKCAVLFLQLFGYASKTKQLVIT